MNFNENITFESQLSTRQITNVLERNSSSAPNKVKPLFKGKIKNNSFFLLPLFGKGLNHWIIPEIQGSIKEEEKSIIELRFYFPTYLKIIFHGLLLLNISALIFSLFNPKIGNQFPAWTFIIGIIVTLFIFQIFYQILVNKTVKLLQRILKDNSKLNA